MQPTTLPGAAPSAPAEETVVVRDCRVRVLTAGEGPPLVYLHGVGDLGGWLPTLADLARDRRVVRPDHPGFNGSDAAGGLDSIGALAEHTLDLLDALALGPVDVIGTSLGGWTAAEVALRAPERVRRLVLVDPAGLEGSVRGPSMFDVDADELVALTCGDAASLAAGRERESAVRADPELGARRSRNAATARRLGGPSLTDPGLAARLAGLRTPTLVVWGELDGLLPAPLAQQWAAAIPDARVHVVAGAGHLPLVDRPAEFTALVRDFLSDVSLRAGSTAR